jgi:sugar phosphate isomerase/epimerase
MRLAYSSLACPAWTVEQAAAAVAAYGFHGIEWRLADGEPITSRTPAPVIQRVVAATRSRGLAVAALDSSCQLVQVDAGGRAATVREAEFMVWLALELGAPAVRVFGGPLPPGSSVQEALGPAADLLRQVAQYGAERGVRILLETHDPAWSHSAHAVALLHEAAVPSVVAGIVYDVLHPCRMGEAAEQTLATLQGQIVHVHLKDGRRPPDGSEAWPLCALGEGDVPLFSILAGLHAQGYDSWYTFEWEKRWHAELADPEVALPAGLAAMRSLLAAVAGAPAKEVRG